MSDVLNLWDYQFMRYAFYAGLLASIAFGIIGTYVVVRRIVFMSDGIAHAAFGGVGLSFYLGISPLLGAAAFSIGSALGLGVINRKASHREDTIIGILLAMGMALGMFFIFITPGINRDPASYLFGNILMLKEIDLWLLVGLCSLILTSAVLLHHKLQAITFDREFSEVIGLKAFALYLYLLVLVALTVVLLIKFLGVILVIAMIAIPSTIAAWFTANMKKIMCASGILSFVLITAGLWFAFEFDFIVGPTIVLLSGTVFIIILLLRKASSFIEEKWVKSANT